MPEILRQAGGDYSPNYTSPLARAARAQEAAGFMRVVETATSVATATGDPSIFDNFDFDTAIPDIGYIQSVPESWMADPRRSRPSAKPASNRPRTQQQIQAAPAAAALMKAHAVQAQAGLPPACAQGSGQPPQG
jgi:hypothetical protein